MRKILFFLIFLIGISINVNAETETRVFMEDKILVIEEIEIEIKERKEVPGVPTGIDAETAHQLVSGELDKKELDKKEEEKSFLFGFPIIKQVKTLSKVVTYNNGWKETDGVLSVKNTKDHKATFFCLIAPAVCVLVVSFIVIFANQSQSVVQYRKLIVFYIGIFFSMLPGALVSVFVGIPEGVLMVILVATMLVGGTAGWFVGGFAGGFIGVYIGSFAGEFIGVFANPLQYIIFIALVEIVSSVIVYIAQKIKL